jgi:hypothetical protein
MLTSPVENIGDIRFVKESPDQLRRALDGVELRHDLVPQRLASSERRSGDTDSLTWLHTSSSGFSSGA